MVEVNAAEVVGDLLLFDFGDVRNGRGRKVVQQAGLQLLEARGEHRRQI